ncbi:MAG: T9SS type A sorting domain-containing protein [Saprospiraceae bacterium]|nr:T9SS type A sorting domain-containing protein [Saprospiraceae bacterium]
MKSKIINLWAFIVLTCLSLQAQTLSPSVISAGGGYATSSIGSLSYTIAEMTMVETFIQGSSMLTQGFQQSEVNTVSITDMEITSCNIALYPNPAKGQIILSYLSGTRSQNTVNIYNLPGAVVLSETYNTNSGLNTLTFDLSKYSRGIYFLELVTEHQGKKIISVNKINLVN